MGDMLDDFIMNYSYDEDEYGYVDWYDLEASILEELRVETEVYED